MALWCVAAGPIVSELLPQLQEVLGQLPDRRRRTALRAAEQIARLGWLANRPVIGETTDAELTELNRLRVAARPTMWRTESDDRAGNRLMFPSLLSVARAERWLKVGTAATYR